MNDDKKDELAKDLLLNFHSQFAENQRNHEQLFVKLLVSFLVLFGGYGYIYTAKNESGILTYGFEALTAIHVVCQLVITFFIWYLTDRANGFRRDQVVVSRIRRFALEQGLGQEYQEKIFALPKGKTRNTYSISENAKGYKPTGFGWYKWVPGFYMKFIVAFLIVQLGFVQLHARHPSSHFGIEFTCCEWLWLLVFVLPITIYWFAWHKYKTKVRWQNI